MTDQFRRIGERDGRRQFPTAAKPAGQDQQNGKQDPVVTVHTDQLADLFGRADLATRSRLAGWLQRAYGNDCVQDAVSRTRPEQPAVQRQEVGTVATAPTRRPDVSDLRTIAQGYVGDYFSAARAGLADFEHDVQQSFDWSAFWIAVGGNVLWAGASFATGGTAFVISLAGIGVSTAAAASAVTKAPDFHREATQQINHVVRHLNEQVVRVTDDVDRVAAARNWDDNQTRAELLRRLVKPEYVEVAAGLPNLSQPRVAASLREELLIRASQLKSKGGPARNIPFGPGYYEQVWKVLGAVELIEYPFSPAMPVLRPQNDWFYSMQAARLVNVPPEVGDINTAMNDVYRTYGRRIDATRWPIKKRLVLTGQRPFGVVYTFDAQNRLTGWTADAFAAFLRAQGWDPDVYLRNLLNLIQSHAGVAIPRADALMD
jgi:hypothetical protein